MLSIVPFNRPAWSSSVGRLGSTLYSGKAQSYPARPEEIVMEMNRILKNPSTIEAAE